MFELFVSYVVDESVSFAITWFFGQKCEEKKFKRLNIKLRKYFTRWIVRWQVRFEALVWFDRLWNRLRRTTDRSMRHRSIWRPRHRAANDPPCRRLSSFSLSLCRHLLDSLAGLFCRQPLWALFYIKKSFSLFKNLNFGIKINFLMNILIWILELKNVLRIFSWIYDPKVG